MSHYNIAAGATSQSIEIDIFNLDGSDNTSVVYNTSGLSMFYRRDNGSVTTITLATLASVTASYSSGGLIWVKGSKYRLDLPNAAITTGATNVTIYGTLSGSIIPATTINLGNVPADVQTIKGQTVTAAAGVTFPSSIGTSTFATGGNVNVTQWGGANVTGMPMPTYTQPTGFLAATFPTTVSSYSGTSQTGDAYSYLTTNLGLLGANAISLAPASTALSTATWTSTRAGYLDTLNGIVANIWAYTTRILTAGTNIVLAKGTGVTGLNDIAATAIVSGGAITTASGKVSGVGTVDTLTTYTGNTPQTGDSYARIGANGAGLTALGDTRIAYLDASILSRGTYSGGNITGNLSGSVGSIAGVTFPTNFGTLSITNGQTIGTSTFATGGSVVVSDKTGFALTTAYDAAKSAASQSSVDNLPADINNSGPQLQNAASISDILDATTLIKGKTDNLPDDTQTLLEDTQTIATAARDAAVTAAGVAPDHKPLVNVAGEVTTSNPAVPPSTGGYVQTITVTNAVGGAVIEGAIVRYSQAGVIKDEQRTNSSGVAVIAVVAGTYTRTVVATPFYGNVTNGVTVAADAAAAVAMTAPATLTPSDPSLCVCTLSTIDLQGNSVPLAAVDLQITFVPPGYAVPEAITPFVSDADGLLVVNLIRGAKYRASTAFGRPVPFTVPDADSYVIGSIIGPATLTQLEA